MSRTYVASQIAREYSSTVQEISALSLVMKSLQERERTLRPGIIEWIGDSGRRLCRISSDMRLFRAVEKSSYSLAVSQECAVDYCKSHGIPVDARSEMWLSPAKVSKYGRELILPSDILERHVETIVVID